MLLMFCGLILFIYFLNPSFCKNNWQKINQMIFRFTTLNSCCSKQSYGSELFNKSLYAFDPSDGPRL